MLNKKLIIIISGIIILAVIVTGVFFAFTQKKSGPAVNTPATPVKLKKEALPQPVKKLISESTNKPAGAKDSYILLTNQEMVIAYNGPENTFIVTANGKSNEEAAKRDSTAYFKALGMTDLGKINIEFRTRGQW